MNFIDNFINKFHSTLIEKDRWLYLLDGLKTTLIITFFAVLDWRNVDTLRGLLHTLTIKKGATEEKHDAE